MSQEQRPKACSMHPSNHNETLCIIMQTQTGSTTITTMTISCSSHRFHLRSRPFTRCDPLQSTIRKRVIMHWNWTHWSNPRLTSFSSIIALPSLQLPRSLSETWTLALWSHRNMKILTRIDLQSNELKGSGNCNRKLAGNRELLPH